VARAAGTVLVVEDQEDVRMLTCMILRDAGYQVLAAAGGEEALAIARHHEGAIRLMLTDVIMPGMNGKELAARMAPIRPATRVIFMSGYTDRVALEDRAVLLEKPFTAQKLLSEVRDALAQATD
jgi:two-component system, cell cycle sensor histidine kinase and response regulator CckA